MVHGVRPHMARGACEFKVAFTTYEAAQAATTNIKGAERPYRGTCCGYYHVTGMTEAEFSQQMATRAGTDSAVRGRMELTDQEYLEMMERDRVQQEAREAARAVSGQPSTGDSHAGEEALARSGSSRRTPTPAEVARRLQARRD